MRSLFLTAGMVLLFTAEILRICFILPFTFSQRIHVVEIAYFFYQNIVWFRIAALVLIAYPALYIFRKTKTWKKITLCACFLLYAAVFFYLYSYLEASQKYQPLQVKKFAQKSKNEITTDKQVIGVSINGEAKAYPFRLIGYHHIISDTIGNMPVIITYCTICRSARVYSLLINGRPNKFRLVGLNQFNAVLEDSLTKSWWQQETGAAIAGPMKGRVLNEVPSVQVSLYSWLHKYPGTEILQADAAYEPYYALLDHYEKSAFKDEIVQTDTATYKEKSLIVAVSGKGKVKHYDWKKLRDVKMLEDSIPGTPLLITIENDNISFHVLDRDIKNETLQFEKTKDAGVIRDINTSSLWNMNGLCIEGELEGTQLKEIQSYQETRQSWDNFHPGSQESDIPVH